MRLNKFIAQNSRYSRRAADRLISEGKIEVNGLAAQPGQEVNDSDNVSIKGEEVGKSDHRTVIIKLNKPAGYVCSRDGQGSPTVYNLLPKTFQHLNYAGRLDKDSSGLLLMTNDGDLINELTHPRHHKVKVYDISLDRPLEPLHQQMIVDTGISLSDGRSRFNIEKTDGSNASLRITMSEGRNRQIRRTFEALGYKVTRLHRIQFGPYQLEDLAEGALIAA